jgi:rhodanese-related sulfurtransferase
MSPILPQELHARLFEEKHLSIIDVLPDDVFEKRHIPSARNACVYEIEFLNKVAELVPDKDAEIIVYGQSDRFEAAALASEKLQENGWARAKSLKGGLDAWKEAGYATTGSGESDESPSGIFNVDPNRSAVRWIGRNLLNQHNGTVGIASASLAIDQERLVGGNAVMDMESIHCEDIEDPSLASMLISHLRTDDFFLVDSFPTAEFNLESAEPIPDATPGSPNANLVGSFTLRGQTQPLQFPATLGLNEEAIALQAHFDIDRVLWGSKYGSGRIYESLGKHIVNDRISISFQLIAPLK